MEIVSRKIAKAAGQKYYFTGKLCKRGHIDKRFVSSFQCMACAREVASEVYRGLSDTQSADNLARRRASQKKKISAEQYNKQHATERAAHRAKRKISHPDYFREHYARNKEKRKAEAVAWYRANAERTRTLQKVSAAKRRRERPEHVKAIGRRLRAKRRAIEKRVFVEVVDAQAVFTRDAGICGICQAAVDPASQWEIDHIVPISKGGLHAYANVQLAHRRCNRAKGAKVQTAA